MTFCRECLDIPRCHCIYVTGLQGGRFAQENLMAEARARGDILQVNMRESYNNLTLKTLHTIR